MTHHKRSPANKKTSNMKVHFMSEDIEYGTPQFLFDALNAEFGFELDVCASKENAKCSRFFSREENGLAQDWGGKTCFCNPPYGRQIGKWMEKSVLETQKGALVVCLIPARTDTRWWHKSVTRGEIRFLRGRLKFDGKANNSAPFPSAIVIFRPPKN